MKNILIVVDMQNDFIYGKFFNKNAQKIVKPIFQEITINTVPYDKIIFTKDTHNFDEFDTINSYQKTTYEGRCFPQHCTEIADSDIVYPLSKTIELPTTTTLLKSTFDGSDRIINLVKEFYPTEKDDGFHIYICGVCTDICVLATAIGLTKFNLIKNITVITNLCAGTSTKTHMSAVAAMKSFKIDTKTTKQIKQKHKRYTKYTKVKGEI